MIKTKHACSTSHSCMRGFVSPSPAQKLMEHGVGFMEKGHYPLALEAFEAAAALEPSFAEVRGEGARTSRG